MTTIKLKRICKGNYTDLISNNLIELVNGTWEVKSILTGEVYFSSNTLKECKIYISKENEILSWSK